MRLQAQPRESEWHRAAYEKRKQAEVERERGAEGARAGGDEGAEGGGAAGRDGRVRGAVGSAGRVDGGTHLPYDPVANILSAEGGRRRDGGAGDGVRAFTAAPW